MMKMGSFYRVMIPGLDRTQMEVRMPIIVKIGRLVMWAKMVWRAILAQGPVYGPPKGLGPAIIFAN